MLDGLDGVAFPGFPQLSDALPVLAGDDPRVVAIELGGIFSSASSSRQGLWQRRSATG